MNMVARWVLIVIAGITSVLLAQFVIRKLYGKIGQKYITVEI